MIWNFWNKPGERFNDLKESLITFKEESQKKLLNTHPHVEKILKKHNIDPEKIRESAPKVLVASALLGALLAYPHLFGKTPDSDAKTETAGTHVTASVKKAPVEQFQKDGTKKDESQSSNSQSQSSNQSTNSSSQEDKGKKQEKNEENAQKNEGHVYGRSSQAPPKEHGMHNLGLHKGEDNNPDNPQKGPHPEELDVVHKKG